MGSKKDLEQLLRRLAAHPAVARIERTKSGHWSVYPVDVSMPSVIVSSTPSDRRGLKNTIAQLRRSGIDVRE